MSIVDPLLPTPHIQWTNCVHAAKMIENWNGSTASKKEWQIFEFAMKLARILCANLLMLTREFAENWMGNSKRCCCCFFCTNVILRMQNSNFNILWIETCDLFSLHYVHCAWQWVCAFPCSFRSLFWYTSTFGLRWFLGIAFAFQCGFVLETDLHIYCDIL